MVIAISGGGTGGHLIIAKNLAARLAKQGIRAIFIGSNRGQDRAWFEKSELFARTYFLQSSGVVDKKGFAKLASLLNILRLSLAARKILTLGICELSKFAALKCAKLGAHAVVRSFSRIDKFTGERTKKYASADGESSKASAALRRKRTASVSSASIKKDASLSKFDSAKKNAATKSVPAKKSPLAKKPVPIAKTASTAKSIAPAEASVSVAKSASAKNASQNVKSRRIAKNTAAPAVIAAKEAAASGASSASTAKQLRRAVKSASAKSSAAGKS
nr:glycosyltransferase [uncultured Campylobacter sp.]